MVSIADVFMYGKTMKKSKKFFVYFLAFLLVAVGFFQVDLDNVFAGTGSPKVLVQQGRLLNSAGDLLGGTGTDYCFKFSIYDASTGGTKVWPSTPPSAMTITVKNGVFSALVGDTTAGGDTLDYNFQDNDTVYLNVDVATKTAGVCGTFESLTPRQRVVSSGFAINANTIGGYAPSQTATANQVPVVNSSGNLVLGTGGALQINIAGDPGSPSAGMIWYDATAGKYKIREGSTTKILCNTIDIGCGSGGSTNWDTIGDPSGNGSVEMGQTAQTLDWVKSTTDSALDGMKITFKNSLATDTSTQRALVIQNLDDAGSTGTTDALLAIDNADTNEAVTDAIRILNTGGGAFTNYISAPNFTVANTGAITAVGVNSGSGLIQGAGGATISGSIALAGTGGNTFTIGNSTGTGTIASGGTSSWTNTSGDLTIGTATSGNTVIDSVASLNLGLTNATTVAIGRTGQAIQLKGVTTPVANGVLYINNSNGTIEETAAATGAQCLVTSGAGAAPTWGSCAIGVVQVTLDNVLGATGDGVIQNSGAHPIIWNWDTITTQRALTLGGGTNTGMTTGGVLAIGSSTMDYLHTTAETGSLAVLTFRDASTNTSGNSITNGLNIATTVNTSGAGTKAINGITFATPTVTACATGACTIDGIQINTIASASSSPLITSNGIDVKANGIGAGVLNGLNISGITPGNGAETAINIGAGWDAGVSVSVSGTGMGMLINNTGTGNGFDIQQNGTDRFMVAANGGLTINGSDSAITRTTTTDFSLGTVGSSLSNANGRLQLSDGTPGNSGQGTITTGGPAVGSNVGAGGMSLTRPDGKYLLITGGATGTTAVYDPVVNSFSAGPAVVCNGSTTVGIGAIALPRVNGMYTIICGVSGSSSTATSNFDPMGTVTSTIGPALSAALFGGAGTTAYKRPDGKYLVTNGSNTPTGTTQIFDPVANTFALGPTAVTGTWGAGAVVLPRLDGTALIVNGGGTSTTNLYNPYASSTGTGVFTVGPSVDGKQTAGSCQVGTASIAMKRQDGKYVIISKASAEIVYDPVANTMTCTTGVSNVNALGDGAHAIPLQNGKFVIFQGGGATANTVVYNQDSDTFSAYTGTTPGTVGAGGHSILLPNGKWLVVIGNGGGTTNTFDTGLPMSDPFPIAAIAGAPSSGGSCDAGLHSYYVTFVTNGVESELSQKSNIVACTGANGTVALSGIPIGPGGSATTARKIYRTTAGDSGLPKLLNTTGSCSTAGGGSGITDNTTTTCTDTTADASLGAAYSVAAATTWYTSEDISNAFIGTGSTLKWTAQLEAVYSADRNQQVVNSAFKVLQFFVKTAVNASGCSGPLASAQWQEIQNSGDSIRAVPGANCIKIAVHFNRAMPKKLADDRGTWFANGNTVLRYDYTTPSLFDFTIDNSAVLKRTSFDFSSVTGSAVGTYPIIPTAPTSSAPSGTSGACTNGNHFWFVTFVVNGQETQLSPASTVQNCTGGNQTETLTIPVGPSGTTARKIYRTAAGYLVTDTPFLVGTQSDNSTTSFADGLADSSLGAAFGALTASGPVMTRGESTRVEAVNNHLTLPWGRITPTTTATVANGVGLIYQGAFGADHPQLTNNAGMGTTVIARDDKTFLILEGGTANAELYDPATQTFTNQTGTGNVPTATLATGTFALKRPDGKFLIVIGGTSTTNIYDQYAPNGSRFVVGPSLTASAGFGAFAILNTDGTFTILHGGGTGVLTTSIYDPTRNTMTTGPFQVSASGVGMGSLAIPLQGPNNNIYKVYTGTTLGGTRGSVTQNYNAATKVFTAGFAASVGVGSGAYAFQRPDGFWVLVGGESANVLGSVTLLINPYSGVEAAGPSLTVAIAGRGGHAIPRADGTFLIVGGNLAAGAAVATQIYSPWGGAYNTTAGTYQGSWSAGPTLVLAQGIATGPGDGAVSFQRPDGKWVTIMAGSTPNKGVDIYDAGWYADGQYLSEQMNVPALAANSTLDWQQTPDQYVRMAVRTATTQAGLGVDAWIPVAQPGGSILNPAGDTWAQVQVNFRRDFPTFARNLNGVYVSSAGMAYSYRAISVPTVDSFQITNGMDLVNLQTNGLSVLRVTSDGNIMSSVTGAFFSGGADLAENYTSTQTLTRGEVVMIDPANSQAVLRSTGQYQNTIVGVVSTAPGFVAGSKTEDSVPIALVGRVPVLFSTENGPIKAGDYLTSASIPGYAMRATQAGRVIGTALEGMNDTTMTACPSFALGQMPQTKCGKITVFVNLVSYSGASVETLMQEVMANAEGGVVTSDVPADSLVQVNGLTASVSSNPVTLQGKILAFLEKVGSTKMGAQNLSEIFTDRVAASLDIIAPQLFGDGLTVDTISSGKDAVTFMSDTVFFGRPYFTTDTAGFAKIAKGDKSVDVVFEKDYLEQPIVNVSLTVDADSTLATEADPAKIQAIKDAQNKGINDLFGANVQFLVVNKSAKGFTIILKDPTTQDINFSWISLAVKNAKTFFSTQPTVVAPPADSIPADLAPTPAQDSTPQPPIDQTPPQSEASPLVSSVVESPPADNQPVQVAPPPSDAQPPADSGSQSPDSGTSSDSSGDSLSTSP